MRDLLPEEWPLAPMDKVAAIFDCPHSTPQITDSGPFVARSQDIRSGVFRADLAAHVSEETYRERIRRAEPRPGDLLFSREGTYFGIAAEVPTDVRLCLGQRMVLIRPGPRVDSRFLRFWLNSSLMREYATGFHDGSVAQRLNVSTIRRLPAPVPSVDEQRRIASVLGALDDKAALNRRMNRTLEATAAALFRSWFVNFDPVVAKAEGRRAPGVPEAVHALMSVVVTEMEDVALPSGWCAGTLDDIAVLHRDQVPPSAIAPGTPYIAMEHMPRRSIALDMWDAIERVDSAKARFERGDVLFGRLRPYFHKVGIAPLDGVCSTEILVLRPRTPEWYGYLVCLASSTDLVDYASAAAEGTRMPRVSWSYLTRYQISLPPTELAKAFSELVSPLFDRILANVHESRSLTALRDSLLPQLLSGTIRLRDAERAVAGAV